MAAPKLVILRPSCFGIEPRQRPLSPDTCVVAFSEVKAWLLDGRVLRHLLRYSEAELATHRIAHISKPFLAAVLLRALARGRCYFSDDAGERVSIDVLALVRTFLGFVGNLIRVPWVLGRARRQAARLQRAASRAPTPLLELSRPPLYLRADLQFCLRAGGSVGHIAGVLNNLGRFSPGPVFVTTDRIPTVTADVETHVVAPGPDFCGFEELPAVHFSQVLTKRALEALAGREVSFVYQRSTPYNRSGLELALRLGVPFVLEYNGSDVWIARNWGRRLRYERTAARIESALLKAAHLVVVVSRPIREGLVERGVRPERVLVNPNGVDVERYSPDVDGRAVRRRYGLGDRRVLGFIGTFGRWHGAEVLAEAFGHLLRRRPDWKESVRLLMIGDGLTRPMVERVLREGGVRELAVLTGAVPQAEGPSHLAACDVLVSPHVPNSDGTPFFGSPTKVFEYMAMGRAIVASNMDQIGEVLEHDVTALLVRPGHPETLAAALSRVLEDAGLARRLGEAARRKAVHSHTWTEHTRLILEALRARAAPTAEAR